ncbi:MAG: GerMN domain-containing protein [Clostridiales bacterium]|jgi:spore germination protein GerM|nr:GerMN domain-containing protein [Clostridiales bacterium]
MTGKNSKRIIGLILIGMLIVYIAFAFFAPKKTPESDTRFVDVYFLNPSTNELVSEQRPLVEVVYSTDPETNVPVSESFPIKEGDYAKEAGAVYDMLRSGPVTPGLAKVYPDVKDLATDLTIANILNTDIRNIDVNFTSAYYNLPPGEEILLRTAIVWTLTQLNWVNEVNIEVDGVELLRSDGSVMGPMDRNNVFINAKRPITQEKIITKSVILYFASEDLSGLVPERRVIQVPTDVSEERVVLNELLNGPTRNGLVSVIPEDTVINEVSNQDNVCYVDLNPSFDSKLLPGSETRALAVYSIVNTLTELSSGNVRRVQFYIDAERPVGRDIDIDLSQTFERDDSYIVPTAADEN